MERNRHLAEQITAEAADWFARLHDDNAPESERDEFAQWLLRSPQHIAEYLAVSRAWGDSAVVSDLSVDELISAARDDSSAENVVAMRVSASDSATTLKRKRYLFAASVLVASLTATTAAWFALNGTPTYETEIGEQRSVTLADGSVVHLNTNSSLQVVLNEHERNVALNRGEARFTVAKDWHRPFLVSTPQATVLAVGTVFNVLAEAERTAVTVIEGRVAVNNLKSRAGSGAPPRLLELSSGQQVEVMAQGEVRPDAGPSVERVLAWPERRLVFRDDSLADVVAEFNRYHKRPIRIEDESLAAIRMSGVFSAADPQSLIQYLERYENVRSRKDSDGVQYLIR